MMNVKLPRRQFLHLAAGAAALPAVSRIARAQAWPTRVVRLLVGFPPGGGMDSTGRIVANRLSEIWGQQVVVENKPGAGGTIAIDAAAHAAPDGYTILVTAGGPATFAFLFPLGFDPVADLAPLSVVGRFPNLMVVPNSSPWKSLKEFIGYAKANPGKINWASPGVGTSPHLAGELFKRMAGIEITHVPYRGVAAGAMSDLLAGRLDAMFNTTGSLLQAVRANQVRGLGVTSGERFATAPEIPTFAESGVRDYDVESFYALWGPARTPREIVKRMNADIVAMLGESAVKARFEVLGVLASGSTPEELAAKARADTELWGPIIKAANIKGE
jgi:tripartite-type tricarboxylate transporter receptor subunit TctC